MKKKILITILCLGVMLSITGCGNQESSNKESSDNKVESSEKNDGKETIVCKAKSNDFANIAKNMKSATRIETYVVADNKVTDFSVNVEVVLDEKKYSKKEVDELVDSLNIPNYTTSKKSDYVINLEASEPVHWFENQDYEDTTATIKQSVELRDYKCTIE